MAARVESWDLGISAPVTVKGDGDGDDAGALEMMETGDGDRQVALHGVVP